MSAGLIILIVLAALWLALALRTFEKATNEIPDGSLEQAETALSLLPLFFACLLFWPVIFWIFVRLKRRDQNQS